MPAPLVNAARRLRRQLQDMTFRAPVTHVYNPLDYARAAHEQYLTSHGNGPKKVLFLGMNPGPWGMAQTGVPFGEVAAARDFVRVDAAIGKPSPEHPKRPIDGLACTRSEVSGRRLWGLFAERFSNPEDFFANHFVVNYCPLMFMEQTGRNRTPDKLYADERDALRRPCDEHLRAVVKLLQPEWVIGVGRFALDCARRTLGDNPPAQIATILHPSPASPAANRGWAEQATRQLEELGVWSKNLPPKNC
jgi:single-strand selective monofunctional uracil DNA glycosylase